AAAPAQAGGRHLSGHLLGAGRAVPGERRQHGPWLLVPADTGEYHRLADCAADGDWWVVGRRGGYELLSGGRARAPCGAVERRRASVTATETSHLFERDTPVLGAFATTDAERALDLGEMTPTGRGEACGSRANTHVTATARPEAKLRVVRGRAEHGSKRQLLSLGDGGHSVEIEAPAGHSLVVQMLERVHGAGLPATLKQCGWLNEGTGHRFLHRT